MVIAGIIYGTQRRKDAKKNIISHRFSQILTDEEIHTD